MKARDRTILIAVGALVLAGAFYMMILSPKRAKVAELSDEVSALETSISEQKQVASFAAEAREQFPTYYGRLVVLGKAVPDEADSASMLVQLNSIAGGADVDFRGLSLSQSASAGTGTAPTATPPAATPPATGEAPATGTPATVPPADGATGTPAATAAPAAAPAPATEAIAASLPIGAIVGPAGLPTLPYNLTFRGGFFNIADFIGGVDSLVKMREGSGQVASNGRLFTIDGFSLKGGAPGSNPDLKASFLVTTYVVPSLEGLTAGASPSGPAPSATATPASGTVAP